MSLWNLPIETLTFERLDDFLNTRLPESTRLDYKAEIPDDLAKVIAALANTLGGLIVLGVDEDRKTTQPIWPPSAGGRGMDAARGLQERVTQIARDAIYPPVPVVVSPVIDNKHLPGKVLLVVRVDESKEAPHAVEKREVLIYERDGNTSKPYRLAEIDRIAHLFERRRRIEEDREQMLQAEIARAIRLQTGGTIRRWAAVVPYYPWRQLYQPSTCFNLHRGILEHPMVGGHTIQQMPDGSYLRGYEGMAGCRYCSRLNSKGLVYAMELADETEKRSDGTWLDLDRTRRLLKQVLAAASSLYQRDQSERPGHLMISLGLANTFSAKMECKHIAESRQPFLDATYRVDRFADSNTLFGCPTEVEWSIIEDVIFAFDIGDPEQLAQVLKQR